LRWVLKPVREFLTHHFINDFKLERNPILIGSKKLTSKHHSDRRDINKVVDKAIEVLKLEAQGILQVADRIDHKFVKMIDQICSSRGRLIVGGIGKSGIIAKKIVATLNSTGTRSLFLHPVEAMHGDLGIVSKDDIFLALSNSGETDELNMLIPNVRNIGCTVIAFTGNPNSTLAKQSDIVIDVGVDCEACPMGLAPTASTTALVAMGDALAVALIDEKQIKADDFKRFHPGGALGQRLSSNVKDLMVTGKRLPLTYESATMERAIEIMDQGRLGATLVLRPDHRLSGIITDGDLRRAIAVKKPIFKQKILEVMTTNPRTVGPDTPTYDALNMMEQYQITVLPVTDSTGKVLGILHLHDILGKGEFKFNGMQTARTQKDESNEK
jgi:arabinose-5-phosphate isomerase